MKRYLTSGLQMLLQKKLVLLMGPRQVGKTTLAKNLKTSAAYYNYDILNDRAAFRNQEWDYSKDLIVFDELHKMRKWKLWLKGLVDQGLTKSQKFLVTGSARLDHLRKVGDSLAGRYFSARLHPIDLKEAKTLGTPDENYKKMLRVSGFPEPFLEGSEKFYHLWSRSHIDVVLKQDLFTLEAIRDIDGVENLLELLTHRVGSTVSYNSLSEDLKRDDKTIKRWLSLLEDLYVVFRVSPYSKNISRSLTKAGKYYFYDLGRINGDEGQKLENLVALGLKKEIDYQEDFEGIRGQLYFLQTKDQRELDFLVLQRDRVPRLYEVKLSDGSPSRNFLHFDRYFRNAKKIQLVRNLDRAFLSKDGIHVQSALDTLEELDLG